MVIASGSLLATFIRCVLAHSGFYSQTQWKEKTGSAVWKHSRLNKDAGQCSRDGKLLYKSQ